MAILLHALAALVFGDLRFSTFLQGAHRDLISMPDSRSATQAPDAGIRNRLLSSPRGLGERLLPDRDGFLRFALAENRRDTPCSIDHEGAALRPHIFFPVQAFFHPNAVSRDDLFFGIGKKRKWEL